jgi:hypothetical protein
MLTVALMYLLFVGLCFGGTWTPTDRSRALTAVIRKCVKAAYDKQDTAARDAGSDPARFSRELNEQEPLNGSRLADLNDHFWITFHELDAPRRGLIVLHANQVGCSMEALVRLLGRRQRHTTQEEIA